MSDSLLSRMRGNLAGMAWPPVLSGRLASLAVLARDMERSQWLPQAEIEARQHRQLVAVATHTAAESPHFARRLASAGLAASDLATPEGLRRLPLLRRRDIQQAGAAFFCRTVPESHRPLSESRSTGSTGHPITVQRTAVSQLLWSAINLRSHLWWRRNLAGRCAYIGVHLENLARQPHWGPPLGRLFETGPLLGIPITTDIAEQVRLLAEFDPETLVVYPNNLDAIRRHCQRSATPLPGLRLILTMAEALTPEIRTAATDFFQSRVFDCYSSGELGVAALECPESGLYHLMAETVLAEVLDEAGKPCAAGEMGRLVLTDLSNFATPIVRYEPGDYAELAGPCPCGRGLPALARILGRSRNILRLPDGRRFWPRLNPIRYRDLAPIAEYQIVQSEPDLLEMKLVVESPLTAKQEADLADLLRRAVGYPFRIVFTYYEGEIPRGPGRKFEEFLCLLPEEGEGQSR